MSFYSYVGFIELRRNMSKLAAHGVQVKYVKKYSITYSILTYDQFHPRIHRRHHERIRYTSSNHQSRHSSHHIPGNKPPWVLPAKSKYLDIDSRRSAERLSAPYKGSPPDLLAVAKTISPLRALHFIKENYSEEIFLGAIRFLFHKIWMPPHVNLAEDANLIAALKEATDELDGGSNKKLFSNEDVEKIMKGRESMKERVKEMTGEAVKKGAFGAPWLMVTNGQGKSEAFFGSDR